MLFDSEKLRPLAVVPPLLATGAYIFHEDLQWALCAFVGGLLATAGLQQLVRWYASDVASRGRGGARFTGLKWQLAVLKEHEAEGEGGPRCIQVLFRAGQEPGRGC